MTTQTLREAIEAEIAHMRENDGNALMCEGVAKRLESILARFPKPSSMTSRCEITVAIDSHGRWAVDSWRGGGAEENVSDLASDRVLRVVVAEVPLPDAIAAIRGEVLP